jgi:signal peptidase I
VRPAGLPGGWRTGSLHPVKHRTGDDDDPGPGFRPASADAGPGGAHRPGRPGPDGGPIPPADRTRADAPSEVGDGTLADRSTARHHASRVVRSLVEWVVVIVGALAVAMVLRAFLFQAFWIPSESMEPTLQRDDRVLVNRLSYRVGDVGRGDVVVFVRPPGQPDSGINDLIKRVVAVGGETVEGRDGRVVVDGESLAEAYLADGPPIGDFGPIHVPDDHVFVMGDNRGNSVDSRVFGPIAEDSIVGRAFVLFWPLDRIGWL